MPAATQKAYRLHTYGGPESIKLDEVAVPAPGPSQVLVAVRAVAINPLDWKIREGHMKDSRALDLPTTLGVDFVGTVAALGAGVSRFAVGQRVMSALTSLGAFAEYVVAEESMLARVPDALSEADAATLPIPGLTAWQALHAADDVRAGTRLLVHGASGTVGALTVQFAKAAGAYVIGTASGQNRDYATSLGVDEFIDYQTERFEDRLRDVDLIIDSVLIGGEDDTTNRSWSVLKPGGAIVSVADPTILNSIPEGYRGYFLRAEIDPATLEDIADQLATGKIKTKVARVFPRDQLVRAMEINKAGGTTGRLIVDFTDAQPE